MGLTSGSVFLLLSSEWDSGSTAPLGSGAGGVIAKESEWPFVLKGKTRVLGAAKLVHLCAPSEMEISEVDDNESWARLRDVPGWRGSCSR